MLRADFPQIPIWPLMMPLAQMLWCAASAALYMHGCECKAAQVPAARSTYTLKLPGSCAL